MIRKSIPAAIATALTISAVSTARADEYRYTVESGYAFQGNRLVFPDGKTEAGNKDEFRQTYGLIGDDRAMMRTIFETPDGKRYQVGHRLEGTVLHFPTGAVHALSQASPEEAAKALTEAYGLVGEPGRMVRTKW